MYEEDLPTAARAIRQRLTTSRALVEASIRRFDEREPVLRAFTWLDRERALRLADQADQLVATGETLGPLLGVPIGVKDIVDTAGIPTENGSPLFAGRVPKRSATVVTLLERAGAIVIGKTVTSELAFHHPGPTTNPFNPFRTPGGSSMGSAAAVAAGIVPAAVGSQTNGSIIRPAAFCGVVGVKPTYGRISRDGVMGLAPTLDHLGGFARTVEGAAWLCAAMAGDSVEGWWSSRPRDAPRLAAIRTKDWGSASGPMRKRFQHALGELAVAGLSIGWLSVPRGLEDAAPVLGTIMRYEAARTVGTYASARPDLVSEVARAFFAEGRRVGEAEYERALRERDRLRVDFAEWAAPYDALLTVPAIGEAPGRGTTGNPIFCTRWTLVGAPAVTIPIGSGPSGLPLGLQLVGTPGDDRRVLAAAAWAEAALGGLVSSGLAARA